MTKEELLNLKIGVISLGCDKNRVDLEYMLSALKDYGFNFTNNLEESDIVLINTCAFIKIARDESFENIEEVVGLKKQGNVKKIFVTGCLPQKMFDELKMKYPYVDKFIKLSDNNKIINIIENEFLGNSDFKYKVNYDRLLTTPKHYAYLKIADGCNNFCSYCTIPFIRGRFRSREMEEIIKEAKKLTSYGVKEINLVAQDLTSYGIDLYKEYKLVKLIQELSKIKNLEVIRLLYCYPELISDELLNEINSNPKVSKYIDIPLQHIDDNVLKAMKRRCNEDDTIKLIEKIKNNYSNICLRSTFIVGFPGEDKKAFKKLCDFLTKYKLDYVGFFKYSKEEYTKAYYLDNQVPEKVKDKRLKILQKLQEKVFVENSKKYINNKEIVLIDSFENDYFVGHMINSVPDVDFPVIINYNENIKIGNFYEILIDDFNKDYYVGELYESTK